MGAWGELPVPVAGEELAVRGSRQVFLYIRLHFNHFELYDWFFVIFIFDTSMDYLLSTIIGMFLLALWFVAACNEWIDSDLILVEYVNQSSLNKRHWVTVNHGPLHRKFKFQLLLFGFE